VPWCFMVLQIATGDSDVNVLYRNTGNRWPLSLSYISQGKPSPEVWLNKNSALAETLPLGVTLRVGAKWFWPHFHELVEEVGLDCTPGWFSVVCETKSRGEYLSEHKRNLEAIRTRCQQDLSEHPEDAVFFCSPRFDERTYVAHPLMMSDSDWRPEYEAETQRRLDFVRNQPATLRNYTKVGFKVQDIPPSLFEELRNYWQQHRINLSKPENHPVFDATLSGRLADTWMLEPPHLLQQRVTSTLRPILAEWAGVETEELQFTAIYGIRMYRHGSVLHHHVDRRETHALSAILEIGALEFGDGFTEWPVEFFDHTGELHRVPNRPGQMILYESATCVHGRPTPFPGREVANMFVHFSPVGWPDFRERGDRAEV